MPLLNWSQFKTLAVICSGIIVAVVPATLTYVESRNELAAKYQETKDNATGGYAALAASIKDLQATVTAQHDFSIRLETHLDDLETFIRAAAGASHAALPSMPTGAPPTPAMLPRFDLPGDFDMAAAKYAPKR
jgi:hypothetical protein